MYPTVDIHTHILPEKIPDFAKKFGYGDFIHLDHHKAGCARMMKGDKFFREIESNCWHPAERIKDCNHSGVDVQVLSAIPVLFNYWARPQDALEVARFQNDFMASVAADYPQRFVAIGTLPMQSPELAARELERCIKTLHMPGVEIGTHINDWNLEDEQLKPFYETANELEAAVFVHPWDMMGMPKMPKYWLPWLVSMPAETSRAICSLIFGGIMEKYPSIRFAFAHGGGSFPATIGRIEHGFKVRPDLCAVDNDQNPKTYHGSFWFDSLVHDEKMLNYLVGLAGPEKVALGTDYPFPLGELEPGALIRKMPFDDTTKSLLLGGAALAWLGLEAASFRK